MTKPIREIRIEGNIAHVPLTQGYEALIDAADVPKVSKWNWCANVSRHQDGSIYTVYARRTDRASGRPVSIQMHRVIAGTPSGYDTDHRDCDGLNNRRSNLRTATKAQNQHNQRPRRKLTASGVKGVSWHKGDSKWQSRLKRNGKEHYLGSFASIEEAAAVYAKANATIHGEFGRAEAAAIRKGETP